MKIKQPTSNRLNKAAKDALLKDVADKLSKKPTLFPEKVARAKALLEKVKFPPNFPSIKTGL